MFLLEIVILIGLYIIYCSYLKLDLIALFRIFLMAIEVIVSVITSLLLINNHTRLLIVIGRPEASIVGLVTINVGICQGLMLLLWLLIAHFGTTSLIGLV
jgi:hypothetical protein